MLGSNIRINLVQKNGSVRHRQTNGPLEQGWIHAVFSTPDLAKAYAALKQKGTDVVMERGGPGGHLVLHDPEGNEIGIAQSQ